MALDGIWARAPYPQSVPPLWDLLASLENRPPRFYHGYDVYDPKKVEFVSDGPEAEHAGRLFETAHLGNSNDGHRFGLELPDADKWALIEFLKTQ